MRKSILKKVVGILKESPLYKTMTPAEKRQAIAEIVKSYNLDFLNPNPETEDIVGYEASWAEIEFLPQQVSLLKRT